MLLHEALKYPNVQKIVGLELDQTVTRKSFQYFHTSPHFDDQRVEWYVRRPMGSITFFFCTN
jgi:spermidine synthase